MEVLRQKIHRRGPAKVNDEEVPPLPPMVRDAILLSIPLQAATALYNYETGYLSRLGVSPGFVELNLTTSADSLFGVCAALLLLRFALQKCASMRRSRIRWKMAAGYALPAGIGVYLIASYLSGHRIGLVIALIGLVFTFVASCSSLYERNDPNFLKGDSAGNPQAGGARPSSPILSVLVGHAIAIVTASLFGGLLGGVVAVHTQSFLVNAASPNEVILRRYGDTFIIRTMDEKLNGLVGPTIIKKLEADSISVVRLQFPDLQIYLPASRGLTWKQYNLRKAPSDEPTP